MFIKTTVMVGGGISQKSKTFIENNDAHKNDKNYSGATKGARYIA